MAVPHPALRLAPGCALFLLLGCKPPVPLPEGDAPAALRTAAPARQGEHAAGAEPHEALAGRLAEPPRAGEPKAPAVVPQVVRPPRRCFSADTALSPPRPLGALLDRAADLYDQGAAAPRGARSGGAAGAAGAAAEEAYEDALVCADEAVRADARSVEAHYSRALALLELGRLDGARDAFTRALALEPDDVKTLAGAADLYINHLPPSVDHTETGLEYARRGGRRVRRGKDKATYARLALLEGQALNDLGHAREALGRLEASLSAHDDVQARYERAVALFDLCRFEEARRGFADVVSRAPDDAWAQHHLGLVLEFLGRQGDADRAFDRAQKERPQEFRSILPVSPADFRTIVAAESDALPAALRADLRRVALETAELPDVGDLTAEEPPLSPTILGLFRGPPLGEAPDDVPRTIVLYRKNLLRAVSSREELVAQVRTTLLHELGHLRGEDDAALRARGLE